MPKLYDLARMSTATTGSGTITLSAAVPPFLTFALAGISDGDIVSYSIIDGVANSEIGYGTYTASGTTLTRTVTKSTNSNAAISLSGNAQVLITPRAEDLLNVTAPQGRLTLTTSVAVPTADVAGATTLYYTPATGSGLVPITFDGATFTNVQFAEVSQATTDTTKSPAAVIKNANYPVYAWVDSGTNRIARGDYLKLAATATMTVASPCVVTISTASLNVNFNPPVVFTTTGGLPTGLTVGTTYYLNPLTATTANVSATPGGTAINTSGSQSGTHTATYGDDNGTPSLTYLQGIALNTSSVTNGPAASRGTFVGVVRSDASSTLNLTFGSNTAGGGPALLHVWNLYNQVQMKAVVGDTNAAWSYQTATVRAADGSNGNRVSWVQGLALNAVSIVRSGNINTLAVANAYGFFGYAVDATNTMSGAGSPNDRLYQGQNHGSSARNFYGNAAGGLRPLAGAHFAQATELGDGANLNTFGGTSSGSFLEVAAWQ